MLSDESSSICPSPTNSLESLPPVPTPPSLGAGEETKVWLGRRGRSASVSLGRKDERTGREETLGSENAQSVEVLDDAGRFETSDEEYIDFDEM